MKELKNLRELILKAEDIVLRVEKANEMQERGRDELEILTSANEKTTIRVEKIVKILPQLEKDMLNIANKIHEIDPSTIKDEFKKSFHSVKITFDFEDLEKAAKLAFIDIFKDIGTDVIAQQLDKYQESLETQLYDIDVNMKKLKSLSSLTNKWEEYSSNFEKLIHKLENTETSIYWIGFAFVGIFIGSLSTYLIII